MATDGRLGAGDIILAFLAGAAAGAVVALLFAPDTGEKTRARIGEKVREGQDRAAELARQGREAFNRQRDTIVSAVERGREAYQQVLSDKDPA